MTDTYTSYEASIEQGRPIQFYRYTLGLNVWRYVNTDQDIQVGGELFHACPMSDDGIKQTGEAQSDAMSITTPDWVGPAVLYTSSPPSKDVNVEILRMHEGMTTLRICYVGIITQVGFPRPGQAVISVQTMSATMKRTGLRLCYQRSCPYAVYDPNTCKADKTAHAIVSFIRSITAMNIVVDGAIGLPDHFFAAGFMEWTDPVRGVQQIMIEESERHGVLTLFDDVQELAIGQPVTIYPGCDQTPTACQVVFANYDNYGGFEYMPGKSPYDGNPIF